MSDPSIKELKSRAQLLKPVIRLGNSGPTPEFLTAFNDLLDRRQLVKLRFAGMKDARKPLSKELAALTHSTLIQQVGHTAVYYRTQASDGVMKSAVEE